MMMMMIIIIIIIIIIILHGAESNLFTDSRKIPSILWNPKFRYHIHKSPPTVPILNQMTMMMMTMIIIIITTIKLHGAESNRSPAFYGN
jgi:hypothetical protein